MKHFCARAYRRLRDVTGLLRHGSARLGMLEQRVGRVEACFEDWHAQLASAVEVLGSKAGIADLARQTHQLRDRLLALERQWVTPHPDMATASQTPNFCDEGQTPIEQAFYLALEQQFRGSELQIADRLGVYRAWMDGLPAGAVADLGCGRGEWLGLLRDWGLDAIGVDSNPLNVAALQGAGFAVVQQDALSWLSGQPSDSYAAITAFHLVEHLSFGALLQLVDHARRVLKPGGRLILETPNPENLLVSTCSFWLDPTHRRPLPPSLLAFVVTYCGLVVEAVPRLNPPEGRMAEDDAYLTQLPVVGRDYAVIAQRPSATLAPAQAAPAERASVPTQGSA